MNAIEQFETHRPLLFSIAYRMLGSAMEAEDMVQESYLRYQATGPETVHSPKAFLSTVVTRLCLNQLQSSQVQRQQYVGPWLPEPLRTDDSALLTPADEIERLESISLAFLTLLESLTPVERAVFLLREVFAYEYGEIAAVVGKSETACRQLFHRAKQHITERRPRFRASPDEHRRILGEFMHATVQGEMDGLMQLLAEDVTLWADGGGKARGAATRPIHSRRPVAQFVLSSTRFLPADARIEIVEANGAPAALVRAGDAAAILIAIDVAQGQISEIRVIANPDKLQRI